MNMQRILAGILAIGLSQYALSHYAFSQEKGKFSLNPRLLPKGVTEAEARKLMDASDKSSQLANAERAERRIKQLQEMAATTADARESLRKILEGDQTGTYKKYKGEIDAASKKKGNDREKGREIAQINERYRGFFNTAFLKANIDQAALRTKLIRAFPGSRPQDFLGLIGREPFVLTFPAPQTDFTLGSPYTIFGTHFTTQGLTIQTASAEADSSNGKIDATGVVAEGAGGTEAVASVGQVIDVPAGVSKVEVTATIRADYECMAMGLLGVAGGWVDGILEAEGTSGNVLRVDRNFGYIVAPVAWYAHTEGNEQFEISGSFSVPHSGGHFQIKASVTANTYTVLNAWSESFNDSKVTNIKVHFVR